MVLKKQFKIGSRAQVMHGTAEMTSDRLRKKDLKYNKYGRIVLKNNNKKSKSKNNLYKKKKQYGGYDVNKDLEFIFSNIKTKKYSDNNEDLTKFEEDINEILTNLYHKKGIPREIGTLLEIIKNFCYHYIEFIKYRNNIIIIKKTLQSKSMKLLVIKKNIYNKFLNKFIKNLDKYNKYINDFIDNYYEFIKIINKNYEKLKINIKADINLVYNILYSNNFIDDKYEIILTNFFCLTKVYYTYFKYFYSLESIKEVIILDNSNYKNILFKNFQNNYNKLSGIIDNYKKSFSNILSNYTVLLKKFKKKLNNNDIGTIDIEKNLIQSNKILNIFIFYTNYLDNIDNNKYQYFYNNELSLIKRYNMFIKKKIGIELKNIYSDYQIKIFLENDFNLRKICEKL